MISPGKGRGGGLPPHEDSLPKHKIGQRPWLAPAHPGAMVRPLPVKVFHALTSRADDVGGVVGVPRVSRWGLATLHFDPGMERPDPHVVEIHPRQLFEVVHVEHYPSKGLLAKSRCPLTPHPPSSCQALAVVLGPRGAFPRKKASTTPPRGLPGSTSPAVVGFRGRELGA